MKQERTKHIDLFYDKCMANLDRLGEKSEQFKKSMNSRLTSAKSVSNKTPPLFLGPGPEYNKVLDVSRSDVVFASTVTKIITDVDLCDHINKTMMSNINFADTAGFRNVDWLAGPETSQAEDHRMAMIRTLVSKLSEQIELKFRCYLTEFFKRYFLYAIVYNCVPYQIISSDQMDKAHEDLVFAGPGEVSEFESKLSMLELRMVDASKDSKNPANAVHQLIGKMSLPPNVQYPLELFFQELLQRNSLAHDFAGFFQNAGLCKLVCFAFRLYRLVYLFCFVGVVLVYYVVRDVFFYASIIIFTGATSPTYLLSRSRWPSCSTSAQNCAWEWTSVCSPTACSCSAKIRLSTGPILTKP